jgi:flagellar biosynthesis GTPase FlhF
MKSFRLSETKKGTKQLLTVLGLVAIVIVIIANSGGGTPSAPAPAHTTAPKINPRQQAHEEVAHIEEAQRKAREDKLKKQDEAANKRGYESEVNAYVRCKYNEESGCGAKEDAARKASEERYANEVASRNEKEEAAAETTHTATATHAPTPAPPETEQQQLQKVRQWNAAHPISAAKLAKLNAECGAAGYDRERDECR